MGEIPEPNMDVEGHMFKLRPRRQVAVGQKERVECRKNTLGRT